MGSISAMSGLERILERHHSELLEDARMYLPELNGLEVEPEVELDENLEGIGIVWVVNGIGGGEPIRLPGPVMDFDDLADRYPDCEVGR